MLASGKVVNLFLRIELSGHPLQIAQHLHILRVKHTCCTYIMLLLMLISLSYLCHLISAMLSTKLHHKLTVHSTDVLSTLHWLYSVGAFFVSWNCTSFCEKQVFLDIFSLPIVYLDKQITNFLRASCMYYFLCQIMIVLKYQIYTKTHTLVLLVIKCLLWFWVKWKKKKLHKVLEKKNETEGMISLECVKMTYYSLHKLLFFCWKVEDRLHGGYANLKTVLIVP